MSLPRVHLIAAARAEREGLGRTIQYAPPDSWEQPSGCPGWWNRDVVAHLASQDYSAAQLIAGERPEELDDHRETLGDEPFSVDRYNEVIVNRRSGLPYRDVLTHWGRAADLLLKNAADLPDEEWSQHRVDWLAGDIGVAYLVQSRVVEWWLHGDDIRLGAGMEQRVEHWPIWLTNDLAVRMLPWALSQAGETIAPGTSLRVDLEGAGGGTWHWGLVPGEVPDEDRKADVFLDGRARAFAKTAGRRMSADVALEEGTLVLGGDEDLGELVLEHVRAYV